MDQSDPRSSLIASVVMEYNCVTTCLADVSALSNNCVPRQRLDDCSVTRPFLSASGVACKTSLGYILQTEQHERIQFHVRFHLMLPLATPCTPLSPPPILISSSKIWLLSNIEQMDMFTIKCIHVFCCTNYEWIHINTASHVRNPTDHAGYVWAWKLLSPYMAVLGRNQTFFHCIFWPCYRIQSTAVPDFCWGQGWYVQCRCMNTWSVHLSYV